MSTVALWSGLVGLGALHGINPAMGWLFAVAQGLQQRDRNAVWRALGPLALGHALAIGTVVLIAGVAGWVLPLNLVKCMVAALLVGSGVRQLIRHAHVRFGGMRMGARDLTIWSFLVSSAHGAGLMVLPFVLRAGQNVHAHAHAHGSDVVHAGLGASHAGLNATLLHSAGYLAVTAVAAVIIYEKVGLRILRTGWFNINLLWAAALIVAGAVTLVW